MKRTRETINYSHPDQRWNHSGCIVFDGEDLGKAERDKRNQAIQKEWLQQQMLENARTKALERNNDM